MTMNKPLFALLPLVLAACTTVPQANEETSLKHESTAPTKTSIFTYHIDPDENYQALARITGTFVWEDGCIFLKSGDYYSTPMFPNAFTVWDEGTKTLTLNGHVFKMGDFITTNGGFGAYRPNTGDPLEKQGDKKCLKPQIAGIGTLGLKE